VWVIRVLIIGALVNSFGQVMNGKQTQREAAGKKTFGFRTERQSPPPGYKPVPTRAQVEHSSFPQ